MTFLNQIMSIMNRVDKEAPTEKELYQKLLSGLEAVEYCVIEDQQISELDLMNIAAAAMSEIRRRERIEQSEKFDGILGG